MLVDPKGGNHARYAGADLIMPDVEELAEATGLPVGTEAEIAAAAASLRRAHGFGAVMVIRGEPGITLVTGDADGEIVQHMPSDVAEVVDFVGCERRGGGGGRGRAGRRPVAGRDRPAGRAGGRHRARQDRHRGGAEDEFLEALTPDGLAARRW